MRTENKRILFFILFSLILINSPVLSISAFADDAGQGVNNGGYVVTFERLPPGTTPSETGIEYPLVSFWNLPLWVQITYISLSFMAAVALIKIFPIFLGRLKHVLDNPKTKNIFFFIQRKPGLTIAELSKEQNINRGTLKYHLGQLLSDNKIILVKNGKFSQFFYNNPSAADKESTISLYLRNENCRGLLFTIMDNPGVTNQDLAGRLELAKSTTHEYLKNFFNDGLVEFRQDGKFKRYYMMQDARMIMLRYRPQ